MAPQRFRMIATYEGIETGDKRLVALNALTTRALPLTLMGMTINPEMGGHGLAEVSGRIDTLERQDASSWIDEETGQTWSQIAGGPVNAWVGEGDFDEGEFGANIARLVGNQTLRGVSMDLGAMEADVEILEEDEDGWPEDWLTTITYGEIAAATVCNIPAFRGCTIVLLDEQGNPMTTNAGASDAAAAQASPVTVADTAADTSVTIGISEAPMALAASAEPWLPAIQIINDGPGCEPCTASVVDPDALVAAGGPLHPPAAWFADPALDGPTALTVDDDGRVYGHLATFGTCHLGYEGQCMTPPRSATGYSLFHVGAVRTAEGHDVAVGHITLGTGHANTAASVSAAAAAEHYDNTGTAVVDVVAGEDATGIWVAGAVRPGVTDEQIRTLRGAALSGDWRWHGRGRELVAALAVNVPGFPVPRTRAQVASGVVVALVAAGVQAQPSLSPDRHVDDADGAAAVLQAAPTRADGIRTAMAIGTAKARSERASRAFRWRS